jgi:hypothetical protein
LSTKAAAVPSAPETIECPLCAGAGELSRAEILDRLGVRDFARVAQLSAEEAFRLLQQKHSSDHQNDWSRFESELTKRTAELRERFKDELRISVSERDNLSRRVEDSLREIANLRERNQELENELSKASRIGRREEMDFVQEARTWAGIWVSEKLPKNGDFLLSYRDASGAPQDPHMLIDVKDKAVLTEPDISKLVRDAKERNTPIAILVARDESQLRQIDQETRFSLSDGIFLLRTTRQSLPRDLHVLKPLVEGMRLHGKDFLEKNAALAEEVRRTFADLQRIEGELGKATKAISSASGLVAKYRVRLQELCDSAVGKKKPTGRELSAARIGQ